MNVVPLIPRTIGLNEDVKAAIDATIERLAVKTFEIDPLVHPLYSKVASVVSSVYKRHGAIIQLAIRTALKDSGVVIADGHLFAVSKEADDLAQDDAADGAHLPYGRIFRHVQIDLIAIKSGDTLGAYEIKRGFGNHDSGKIRSMLRDLRCIRMLLKSYGERVLGIDVRKVDSRLISYYGKRDLPDGWTLDREELDAHFGVPVMGPVELANQYFSDRLDTVLEGLE